MSRAGVFEMNIVLFQSCKVAVAVAVAVLRIIQADIIIIIKTEMRQRIIIWNFTLPNKMLKLRLKN